MQFGQKRTESAGVKKLINQLTPQPMNLITILFLLMTIFSWTAIVLIIVELIRNLINQ